ncbi:MAG TPA: hypothetical protein VF544_02525 [Pyrinomonadaceae bacterium]|jgi:hypothetical protein
MRNVFSLAGAALLVLLLVGATQAQRPRSVGDSSTTSATVSAPQTVNANYEGGVFGYNKKINGTLSFDDRNERLLFRDKQQKEILFIPYRAVLSAFADTKAKRPIASTVISNTLPYGLGLPALLWKKKFRYLTMQYRDPDTNAEGITSFKLENKETLEAMLSALAGKAGLTQRGEIYVRRTGQNSSQQP